MKHNQRPAPFNFVPGDTEGTTWALPEGALARLGKGNFRGVKPSPNGMYFAVATGMGLWWYEMSSKPPIALWETERGMISAVDFSQDGEWIAIANYDGIIKVVDIQSGECLAQMKPMEEHKRHYNDLILRYRILPRSEVFAEISESFLVVSQLIFCNSSVCVKVSGGMILTSGQVNP